MFWIVAGEHAEIGEGVAAHGLQDHVEFFVVIVGAVVPEAHEGAEGTADVQVGVLVRG